MQVIACILPIANNLNANVFYARGCLDGLSSTETFDSFYLFI